MEGISSILEIASGKDNQKFAFSSSEKNWKQIFIKNNYFVDLLVDIPKFWDFFAAVLAPALLDTSLPMKFIQTSCSGEIAVNL